MQKVITVCLDTIQLLNTNDHPFAINEIDNINDLLEEGWEIEEWDFLKEDAGDGKILLLIVLSDDAMFNGNDFEFDMLEEMEEAEEEATEENKKEINGKKKKKK